MTAPSPGVKESAIADLRAGMIIADVVKKHSVRRPTVQYWRDADRMDHPELYADKTPTTMADLAQKYVAPKIPPPNVTYEVMPAITKSDKPRIMTADVECLPNKGFFFRTWTKQNIPIPTEFIEKHYALCSISWKWLGEDETHVVTNADFPEFDKDPYNDKGILNAFIPELKKADFVVAHNGKRFDMKIINTRVMLNRLPPIPQVTVVDTLLLARNEFEFNSNKLDYLTKLVEIGQKKHTSAELWVKVANGDREAMQYMGEYNAVDTKILEEFFLEIWPYLKKCPINYNLFSDSPTLLCKSCGSDHIHLCGRVYTPTSWQDRYECKSCGAWSIFPRKKVVKQ